jgi:hypothetical protein
MSDDQDVAAGQQIPGSRFYRMFCARCEEPMRVTGDDLLIDNYCEECAPRPLLLRPATREDEAGPWYENARRAMEDGYTG